MSHPAASGNDIRGNDIRPMNGGGSDARRSPRFVAGRLAALLVVALLMAGCTDEGGFGSALGDEASTGDTAPATGPLRMSLSRGLDEEIADVKLEENYSVRFTIRNGPDGPASMDGIQLEQVEGDLRFTDALAGVRTKGLDREGRVFQGWIPNPEDVGIEDLGQFSTATIPPGGALDVLVAFRLGSGDLGRFSGITVAYSAGGVGYRPTFEGAVALCRGNYTDGEDCAGQSQLDRLIDLKDVGKDPDLPNDVGPAN